MNATNDDDEEEDDVEPLEWLNCAANKANMANKEMVICSTLYHKYEANIIWRTISVIQIDHYARASNNRLTGCLDLEKLAVTAPSLPG